MYWVIRQAAIDAFLARVLDDFDWLKKKPVAALDEALQELKPPPSFGNLSLWAHQKVAFLILNVLRRFMLHIDMGGGKTNIVLSLLRYRKQCGDPQRAIVFVPYVTSVSTWIDQVEEHAPDLKCVPLIGTTKQNLDYLQNTPGDLFVISYPSAVAAFSETVPGTKGKKTRWRLRTKDVKDYFSNFNVIVLDEIHRCKNASSLAYIMCRAISAQCEWAIGLTGTPFNKDLGDLWPQFYLVDFGATLGPTLGFFREVFFDRKINYWGGFEYKFKKKLFTDLQRIIKNISISYSISELNDMPERKFIIKHIDPKVGQEEYARLAIKRINEAVAKDGGSNKLSIVKSNYLQLRQLSSGFMTLHGDDVGKVQIKFEENPKLDALVDLIEAMPVDRKMVVFHHFVYTNQLISERLTTLKIGHARVWSGQRDVIGELKRFKQSQNCRVLVINSKMGSSSLNLQFANYVVFFEQPDSSIDRSQAEARVWRPGQQHRVMNYDLFVRGTYDEAMHRANKAGEALLQKLLHPPEHKGVLE